MKLIFDTFPTPLGDMTAVFSNDTLCLLDFSDNHGRICDLLDGRFAAYEKVTKSNPQGIRDRVKKYFKGEPDAFTGLKLQTGGTAFQQLVWRELGKIRHGHTVSYGELAHAIGRPKAHRAVGSANGRNPISLVIPCHRVIAGNGGLAGYAGGVERKRKLLSLEKAL